MNASEFRAKLVKIMPGYQWVIHTTRSSERYQVATGTQSSGFNRLSTLEVTLREDLYEVKSAGFGKRAPWLHTASAPTLARALRELQDHYETMARVYSTHANDLKVGRMAKAGAQ